jgi:hypothetical protein
MTNSVRGWKSVLTLDQRRNRVAGTEQELIDAIRRGADLRIYTEFRHNEHLDTESQNDELVQEVSEFRVTYLLDDRWIAGIMTLRQPIVPPTGFGPRPSMSFFLYNQDGQQAIARPYLDGALASGVPGAAPVADLSAMPKYRQGDNWDDQTNAPSHNFVYEFDTYRFCVRDDWQEVLGHTSDGSVLSGSLESLTAAFRLGAEIKIAIRGLSSDLADDNALPHEVFVQTGPGYFHTRQKLFVAGSHPLVRVRPAIPLCYQSRGWDFGWLMVRTDGFVARSLVDPYTLQFSNTDVRHELRWFVR